MTLSTDLPGRVDSPASARPGTIDPASVLASILRRLCPLLGEGAEPLADRCIADLRQSFRIEAYDRNPPRRPCRCLCHREPGTADETKCWCQPGGGPEG